ncbi:hypothetical protein ACL58G_17055 [Massilia sp. GER05]|uniref:hypothetical protein n=1 Tax=Massilia sp. GER05 TaxID=3394605 RepID=UPI003F8417EF
MRKRLSLCVVGLGLSWSAYAAPESSTLAQEISDGFYSRINGLAYGLYQDTLSSPLNPNNSLGIASNQAAFQFRPDFNLKLRAFEFDLRPRFYWTRSRIDYPGMSPDRKIEHKVFLNEGSIRFRPHDRLTLSYGRENLQWGPSSLVSPSNPFNANNGKNNPNLEQPGLDYARAVYVASSAVTVSLIDNTGKGRLDPINRYRKARAVKLDFTGDKTYFSLIGSKASGEGSRIGGFAGWNVSDALLLHAEASAGRKSNGPGVAPRNRQLLTGASYTLESGPTLTAEYFFNKDGCPDAPIQTCLQRRGALLDPVLPLARRRYAMLQFLDTKIAGKLNLTARYIRNLDDVSSQFIVNAEYELGDHLQLLVVPAHYRGAANSEFGSLLHRSVFVGASYTY